MNGLYCEINVYNNNFWSKYLFIMWFLLGYLLVLILYMITFVELQPIIKIIQYYNLFMSFFIFIFIFSLPSSVNHNVNKTYKFLTSFSLKIDDLYKVPRNDKLSTLNKVNYN